MGFLGDGLAVDITTPLNRGENLVERYRFARVRARPQSLFMAVHGAVPFLSAGNQAIRMAFAHQQAVFLWINPVVSRRCREWFLGLP
jgi:hypothetical protein